MIDCVIQHHPKRAARIPALLEAIGGEAVVVTDPDPDAKQTNSWRTYQECLKHARTGRHLLILQDDVEPFPHMLIAAEEIARYTKTMVVCLWHGSQPTRGAIQIGASAGQKHRYAPLRAQPWVPLVACMWPGFIARDFLAWAKENDGKRYPTGIRTDDGVATRYLTAKRHRVVATIPSLVEHPDTDSIRKKPRGRTALRTPNRDLLDYDWSDIPWPLKPQIRPR